MFLVQGMRPPLVVCGLALLPSAAFALHIIGPRMSPYDVGIVGYGVHFPTGPSDHWLTSIVDNMEEKKYQPSPTIGGSGTSVSKVRTPGRPKPSKRKRASSAEAYSVFNPRMVILVSGVAAFLVNLFSQIQGRFACIGTVFSAQQPMYANRAAAPTLPGQTPVPLEGQYCVKHDALQLDANSKRVAKNVSRAVANLIIGTTMFTLPYCFVLSGWMTMPVICVATLAMLYTAQLLGEVMEEVHCRKNMDPCYGSVSELAFGPTFRPIFKGFCLAECFFMSMLFLVFIGHNLHATFMCPPALAIWSAATLGVLVTYVPQEYMSLLAFLGIFMTVFASGALMASGLMLPVKLMDAQQSMLGLSSCSFTGVLTTFAAVSLCIGDHAVLPSLYTGVAARDGAAFKAGLSSGFYLFLALALVVSGVAYASFGTALAPVALANIGRDLHGQPMDAFPTWLAAGCNIALSVRSLVVLPSFLQPVIASLRDMLPQEIRQDATAAGEKSWGVAVARFAITCFGFYMCAVGGHLVAGHLAELETFTCSLFKSVNVFIIPCWGYFVLCKDKLRERPLRKVILFSVLFAGVMWGVFGTASAVRAYLSSVSGHGKLI